MHKSDHDLERDVHTINQIDAIPSILDIIASTTGMGFAAVARVTEDRWVTCVTYDKIEFGLLPGDELDLKTTICNEIRQHQQPVAIDNVAEDSSYLNHHTPALYGFKSYISVPIITKSGEFFGTLCAIDPKPAAVNNPTVISMFTLFADLIAFHMAALDKLSEAEKNLVASEENNGLKEQFIAILGHDLRNPVGAISNASQLLLRMNAEEPVKRLANIIKDSSYRMNGLINNTMDFASGRLGGGIVLDKEINNSLKDTILHVIRELQLIWPERPIEVELEIDEPVLCDNRRIAQLLSNLLSNALTHGATDKPVFVSGIVRNKEFTLTVRNSGAKIPESKMSRLFQPFYRGNAQNNKPGLGLGLYISSEIARAHGGTLEVSSTDEETVLRLMTPAC